MVKIKSGLKRSEKATIVEGEKKSRYFMHGAVLWYITVVLHFIMYFAS